MKTRHTTWLFATALGIAVTAAAVADSSAPAGETGVDSLVWLAGTWGTDDRKTEEHWLAPRGGVMVGVNRSIGRSGRAGFEFLRIVEDDGGVAYLAQPGGRAATSFRLVESAPGLAVFENLEHDFPQRIRYRLTEDGHLEVQIAGEIDGQERESSWLWKRLEVERPVLGRSAQERR